MLSTLIKIRLQGIFKKNNDVTKNKTIGKKLIFIFLAIYFVGVFGMMFITLFSALYDALMPANLGWFYFTIMAVITLVLCFVGSVFMVQQEIYNAKDNDLLLSMPITNRDILLSRLFSILLINYGYEAIVVLPAIGVYLYNSGINVATLLILIIVFATLPLFSLALSCIFGWLLALIVGKFQNTTAITLVLSIGAMVLYFYGVNQLPNYVMSLISNATNIARSLQDGLFPFYHLGLAILDSNIVSLIIYLLCELVPLGLVYLVLSSNFISIVTRKNGVKKVSVKDNDIQYNSIKMALFKREVKHFFSNAMVILNGCVGLIFAVGIGGYVLINSSDINAMIHSFSSELGFDVSGYLMPVACLSIISTTAFITVSSFMISLEGDRLWIIKSLPIRPIDILESKLNLHYILCIPACLILSIVFCILLPISIMDMIMLIITPVIFAIFSGVAGILINLWKPKFDWVNETVVVKQSMSVTVFMFGGMALVILLAAIGYFLADIMSLGVYVCLVTIIFTIIDIVLYRVLNTWGVKRFEEL